MYEFNSSMLDVIYFSFGFVAEFIRLKDTLTASFSLG